MAWELKENHVEFLEYIIGQTGGNLLIFLFFLVLESYFTSSYC